MSTWATVRTAIRSELQESQEGFWLNADLLTWGNVAYSALIAAMRVEATATIVMVPGTESYSLPADFALARRVEIQSTPGSLSSWLVLQPLSVDYRDPGDLSDATTRTGTPYGWYVFGNKIYFTPIPNGAFSGTLYYYKNITALAADGDALVYPEGVLAADFDDAILLYVCSRAFRKRQDGSYTTYANDWNEALAKFTRFAAERGSATPPLVTNDWDDE